jgi:glycosyltransferase involved in cell wall biosynthesis
MNVALVYDWLVAMGGGEKALAAIYELFSGPIYTLIRDDKQLAHSPFADAKIISSFMQQLPFAKKKYRYFLPIFPFAVEQFDLTEFDLVLSISHAVAKGALTHPHQLHICYCFTPMRYIWNLTHQYLRRMGVVQRAIAQWGFHRLRNWDIASIGRVDHFIAISHVVARRIKKVYGRDADVIYPPVDVADIALGKNKESFYLTVSRLVPYKRIDLIVEAFAHMPERRLIVVGDGPEAHYIEKKAGKNVELLGLQSTEVVRDLMQRARGFIFAAEEDFGIVVLEAQAAGTPVVAFGKGGATETIVEGKTGLFFQEQTVSSLVDAVDRFEKSSFDPDQLRTHALRFSKERFQSEFRDCVTKKYEAFAETTSSNGVEF